MQPGPNLLPATQQKELSPLEWCRLALICISLLLEGLSLSSINVQIGSIGVDLNIGPDSLQWIVIAFPVSYASILLAGGLSADRYGSRLMFVLGMFVFTLGSGAAAFALGPQLLTVARGLQGGGAALATPAAIALIAAEFPVGRRRNIALGWFSSAGAIGFTTGGLVIGLVTERFGWRSGFLIFLVPSVLSSVLASLLFSGTKRMTSKPIPWIRVGLNSLGVFLLFYAIANFDERSAVRATMFFVLSLAVFLVVAGSKKNIAPIVEGIILHSRDIRFSVLSLGVVFSGVSAAMFFVSISTRSFGYDSLSTGLLFLPQGAAVALVSPLVGRLLSLIKQRNMVYLGLVFVFFGLLLYAYSAARGFADHLLFGSILVGIGIGLVYPATTTLVSNVSENHQGTSAGVLTTGQQLGSAFGVVVLVAVTRLAGLSTPQSLLLCACLILTAALPALCKLKLLAKYADRPRP